MVYNPWGHKELGMAEWLTYSGKSFLNKSVHGLAIRLLQKVDSEDLTSKPLLPRTAPAQSQHHALSSLS